MVVLFPVCAGLAGKRTRKARATSTDLMNVAFGTSRWVVMDDSFGARMRPMGFVRARRGSFQRAEIMSHTGRRVKVEVWVVGATALWEWAAFRKITRSA